jgi:hypothetical protein
VPRRSAALALLLALLPPLAACSGDSSTSTCPGERVASFRFTGTRVAGGDPTFAALDPTPAAPDCTPPVGYPPVGEPLPAFDALLTHDPVTAAAALCKPGGIVLYGERSGANYAVETGTTGAVLGACAETCTAGMRLVVAGKVATSADGEPTTFDGWLFETMSALDGSLCGGCTLPCEARYRVTGTR